MLIVQNTGVEVVSNTALELKAEDMNEVLFDAMIMTSLLVNDC